MPKGIKQLLFGGPGAASVVGDVGLALARISLGVMMAWGHGRGKLLGNHGFGPPDFMIDGLAEMGLPMPTLMAWLAGGAEFFAAILLALGLLTRPAALTLVINMSVAAFFAHAADPFFMAGGPAKEPAILYLIPFAMFLFTGAGRFSIDRLIRGKTAAGRGFPVQER